MDCKTRNVGIGKTVRNMEDHIEFRARNGERQKARIQKYHKEICKAINIAKGRG